jgi:hypothetical protein
MNSREAIDAIKSLLGLKSHAFGMVKTIDGAEFRYENMELNAPIYVVTEEGEIPAPEGTYELEDGMIIGVKEGFIKKLDVSRMGSEEEKMEEKIEVEEESMMEDSTEVDKVKMVEAELIDGTLVEVEGEELVVGAKLMVKTADGLVAPPDADHETKDGMIITTKDGMITEIKEKVMEEETEISVEEMASVLKSVVEKMTSEITSLKNKNAELESKFNKFSAEPAGKPMVDRKGYVEHKLSEQVNKLEQLARLKKINNK